MRPSTVICILAFTYNSACGAATWAFRGAPAQTVTIDDTTFVVRVNEGRAEAVRVTSQFLPNTGLVFEQASRAIEQASGCRVDTGSLRGDPAVVQARIECG